MITEQDLLEAIAECKGQRNPSTNTCIKLAAFLIIQREMFLRPEQEPEQSYSFAASPEPIEKDIRYNSDTEFSGHINGKNADKVWPILDELMSVLQLTNKRLHDAVIKKLDKI